jgi:uncharacterized repeat protein (TIGR03803 family)
MSQATAYRVVSILVLSLVTASSAQSFRYRVLQNFNKVAATPRSGLIVDTFGNAYGTTEFGGHKRNGTVYQLSPTTGYHIIYAFSGAPDGGAPGNLVMDSAGNMYGTTYWGGTGCTSNGGCGTVFELTPPTNGGGWTETVLYNFQGDAHPWGASLIFDTAGNLYGTTEYDGEGFGTVYQLVRGPNGQWTHNLLYAFTGKDDGGIPVGSLVFDSSDNLYGTAQSDGAKQGGTVFELSGGNFSVLYAFDGQAGSPDGNTPAAGLAVDSVGNLYGTTALGGEFDLGTVYKLTPNSGSWEESILHAFSGSDGSAPGVDQLVFDSEGRLYGTTQEGGPTSKTCSQGCGAIFRLTPQSGGQWSLSEFLLPSDGSLGMLPDDTPLHLDEAGNVYGTTYGGGRYSSGVVFEITP